MEARRPIRGKGPGQQTDFPQGPMGLPCFTMGLRGEGWAGVQGQATEQTLPFPDSTRDPSLAQLYLLQFDVGFLGSEKGSLQFNEHLRPSVWLTER